MRIRLSMSILLAGSIAVAAACSSTPSSEEPVASATASSDMAGPEATAEPTASAQPTSQPTSQPTAQPTTQPTTQPKPAAPAWKDMTKEQKTDVMKTKVMPEMSKKFQEFDAKKFAKFDCATCHGKAAKAGDFKMPNPDLPKLNPANEFAAHKKQEKMLQFMFAMTPQLAGILGVEPYDPAKKAGFGCFSCHTMKK